MGDEAIDGSQFKAGMSGSDRGGSGMMVPMAPRRYHCRTCGGWKLASSHVCGYSCQLADGAEVAMGDEVIDGSQLEAGMSGGELDGGWHDDADGATPLQLPDVWWVEARQQPCLWILVPASR